jgi:hypothetical protein
MVKTFPKHIFVTTLLITMVVFTAGLFLGWQLDNFRTLELLDDLRVNELDSESFLVEQAFWETFGGGSCEYGHERLNSLSVQLAELGQYLNKYEKKSIFEEDEFQYLARRYFILEIKAYTQLYQLQQDCELNTDYILYFYGQEDDESENQGYVLDKLVSHSNGTVDIFSINYDYQFDYAIETAKAYYNVTSTPTLIINGEEKIEGFVSYQELRQLINAEFT